MLSSKKISLSAKIDRKLSIFMRMREWEKRLTIKKGIYRIAGRIVEEHSENQKKIDFCPCYIRRYLERKKKEEKEKRRAKR
jgi:hypothetical protein